MGHEEPSRLPFDMEDEMQGVALIRSVEKPPPDAQGLGTGSLRVEVVPAIDALKPPS